MSKSTLPVAAPAPDIVILDRDFGFSVNGILRVWAAKTIITGRADIAELIAHGAPLKAYKEIPNG